MPNLDLGNLLVHLNADISRYASEMARAETIMQITANKMIAVGKKMTMAITIPLTLIGIGAVKAFADFDSAMTRSLAIMQGITPPIREEMSSLAREMAVNGVTSAKQLAESYFFLASAGLDAEQSMAALGAVEAFAVAGAFDMATATDLATDAQSALGLTVKDAQANLTNMTRVTDVLTGANTLANASTEQFALALTSGAGPAMKAYGIQLEEGVAVLAAYADQGIKAQNAGNMFSRMLRLMTKGFIDNRATWEQFNINIFTAEGALKPMATIIGDLSNALGSMSVEQKIVSLQMLGFQARSQQAILPLLGLQNRIAGYNAALEKMNGITKEVAEKQLKSFSSQMKILKNHIVEMGISIGDILAPSLLDLNEKIQKLTDGWKHLDDITKTWIVTVAKIVAVIGPLLLIFGGLIKLAIIAKVAFFVAGGALIAFLQGAAALALGAVFFHPVAVAITLISIAAIAAMNNISKTRAEIARMSGIIQSAKGVLKTYVKTWQELNKVILESSRGRMLSAQAAEEKRILEMRLQQLRDMEADFKSLNFFDKILQGDIRADLMEGVSLQIKLAKKRLESLENQAKETFTTMQEEAEKINILKKLENAPRVLTDEQKSIQTKLNALDRELEMLGWVNDERERAIDIAEFEAQVREAYANDMEKQIELMDQYQEKLDAISAGKRGPGAMMLKMKLWVQDATNVWSHMGDVAVNALNGITDQMTNMLLTGKMNMRQFAQMMLAEIARIIVRALIAQAILMAIGMASPVPGMGAPTQAGMPSIGGGMPGTMMAADGVAFTGGRVIPYAMGGVVTKPTFFPMAKGMGLMGEAGPEAVMPLARGSNGKLGVQSEGGGSSNIKIINVLEPKEMLAALSTTEGERSIINIIKRNRGIIKGIL